MYVALYVLFGIMFLGGFVYYWIASAAFREELPAPAAASEK